MINIIFEFIMSSVLYTVKRGNSIISATTIVKATNVFMGNLSSLVWTTQAFMKPCLTGQMTLDIKKDGCHIIVFINTSGR